MGPFPSPLDSLGAGSAIFADRNCRWSRVCFLISTTAKSQETAFSFAFKYTIRNCYCLCSVISFAFSCDPKHLARVARGRAPCISCAQFFRMLACAQSVRRITPNISLKLCVGLHYEVELSCGMLFLCGAYWNDILTKGSIRRDSQLRFHRNSCVSPRYEGKLDAEFDR